MNAAHDLRTELRLLARRTGPNVTQERFCQQVGISRGTITRCWGTWTKLRVAAGLPARPTSARYLRDFRRLRWRRRIRQTYAGVHLLLLILVVIEGSAALGVATVAPTDIVELSPAAVSPPSVVPREPPEYRANSSRDGRTDSAQEPEVTERLVIIGSGPAGWSAAIYASRANLEPLVYEGAQTEDNRIKGTLPLGQLSLTTEVENYPGFPAGDVAGFIKSAVPEHLVPYRDAKSPHGITGPELMELMRQQAKNFGTRVVTDDVISVDLSKRPFALKTLEGQTVDAHALIIATGARANYLGLPSEDKYKNRGVSACAVCDGALPRFRNQPLVVVGGGDSAMEEASYLTKFASTVHLVHRRDEFRASKIMAQRVLENPKIKVQWSSAVDEVLGDDQKGVTGVKLKSLKTGSVETLPATGMFCAIGHTPNTDFLNGQVKTDDKGYIVWTEMFRTCTSVEGVFAAGDVADSYYRQAITSAGTGCMAALDAERWLAAKGVH